MISSKVGKYYYKSTKTASVSAEYNVFTNIFMKVVGKWLKSY